MDRRRIVRILTLFLGLMLLFTVLSRAADSAGIAHVQTKSPQSMTIDHTVTGSGKVEQNREQAVSALENQKVKSVYVNEGEEVEQGTVLFDLDIAELKEQILEKKQEIEKMDLQLKDSSSKNQAEEQLKENQKRRASEDINLAASKGDRAVARALESLQKSRQSLNDFRAAQGQEDGGEDSVLAELMDSLKEKEKACLKSEEELKELERKAERAVNKGLDEAEKKNRQLIENTAQPIKNLDEKQSEESETVPQTVPQTEDLAAVEKKIRREYQKELEKAQNKLEKAQGEKEAANQAVQQYQQDLANRQSADAAKEEQQLIDDVNEKQQAYEDALTARDEGVLSAGRTMEDANAPEGSDSTDKISKLDRDKLQMELQRMEALLDAGGQIKAPIKGVITKIAVTTGEKTVDGTAMLMADTSNGSKFTAQIPANQEKYIAKDDPVTLRPANNGNPIEGLKVESVKSSGGSEDMLDITVKLPPDSLEIGTAADFEITRVSQTYSSCIPISALHQDNNEYFVYVIQESESILGKELIAQKVIVRVMDQNESYAAIQEGAITSEQKLITNSDKAISGGSRVRLMEE